MAAKYTRRLIGGLSLSAGLPFGLFFEAVPAFLHQAGTSNAHIGLFSLLQLPWIGKPLWAPFVDRSRRHARFFAAASLVLAAALGGLAFVAPAPTPLRLCVCLLVLATSAATLDLVVDATFVAHAGPNNLGGLSAARMAAYKAGVLGGGGAVVALGAAVGWRISFAGAAAVAAGGGLFFAWALRADAAARGLGPVSGRVAKSGEARTDPGTKHTAQAAASPDWATFRATLRRWLKTPGMLRVLAFIFLYKMTLCCLGPLSKPFWLEHGASALQLGAAFGAVGLTGALTGSLTAALVLRRCLLSRALLLGSGLEALTALGYLAARLVHGPQLLLPCVFVEGLAQGLTTTLLTALIARLCDPAQAATQFAVLGAAFGLARVVGGPLAGLLATRCGWTLFLALTPWLSLLALSCMPALRRRLAEGAPAQTPPAR